MFQVKQEPSLLPGFNPAAPLGQESCTASGCQPQVCAVGHTMTERLQMCPEVKGGGEEERLTMMLEKENRDLVTLSNMVLLVVWGKFC